MNKGKRIALFIVIVLFIVCILMLLLIQPKANEENTEVVMVEVPEGEAEDVETSKSEAYRKSRGKKESPMDAYFESLLPEEDDASGDVSLVGGGTAPESVTPPENRMDRVLGTGSQSTGGSTTKVSSGVRRHQEVQSQQSSDDKYIQDLERAQKIAAAINGTEGVPVENDENRSVPIRTEIRKSSIISSLDDDFYDGDGPAAISDNQTVKCMFTKDEKVRNGQRVTVRTLQEISVDGTVIPANTHLSAVCNLNERLNLNISSVEINGRILCLDYEAYDYDGNKGIYCPETSASRNGRTVADQAVSTGTSIVGGRLGSVANAVVRTGASLFRNASGESYVNLKSGYEFYIMKKQ